MILYRDLEVIQRFSALLFFLLSWLSANICYFFDQILVLNIRHSDKSYMYIGYQVPISTLLTKLGEKILSKKGQFLVNFLKNIFDNRCRYKKIVVVSLLNAKITLKQETSFRPKKIRIFLLSPTQFITIQDTVTQVFLCTLNLKCCYTLKIKVLTRYTFLSLLLFTGEWTPTQYYLGMYLLFF